MPLEKTHFHSIITIFGSVDRLNEKEFFFCVNKQLRKKSRFISFRLKLRKNIVHIHTNVRRTQ